MGPTRISRIAELPGQIGEWHGSDGEVRPSRTPRDPDLDLWYEVISVVRHRSLFWSCGEFVVHEFISFPNSPLSAVTLYFSKTFVALLRITLEGH